MIKYSTPVPGGAESKIRSAMTFFVIVSLVLTLFSGTTVVANAQERSSDLVVEEGEKLTITGPEFGLKGSVIVREGATLNIVDTEFTIYQEYERQEDILVETGGEIKLENSVLRSDRAIDKRLEEGSSFISRSSSMISSGSIEGTSSNIEIIDSEVEISEANFHTDDMLVEDSSLYGEHWTVSVEEAEFRDSLVYSSLIFHSNSYVEFAGSEALSLEVRDDSSLDVLRKVEVQVIDSAEVPMVGADVEFVRRDTEEIVLDGVSGEDGLLRSYVPSETISGGSEDHFGNMRVEVNYADHHTSKNIALAPVQRRVEDELEIDAKELEMRFDSVLPPSEYYSEGRPDIILDDDDEKVFRTYPTADIDSYIHEGNMILRGNSKLVLDSETDFRILQDDENFRVELHDESELVVKEGASIKSDSPLNFYLYDSSRLDVSSGITETGLLYTEEDAMLELENSFLNSETVKLEGRELSMIDSDVEAEIFKGDVDRIDFAKSTLSTIENVSLKAEDIEMRATITDRPIYLESEDREVDLVDVETPRVKVAPGTTVLRSWTLDIDILNSQDKYVPSSEVEIYDMNNVSVKSKFVLDGRTNVTLPSEKITHEGKEFLGNYIIRGRKELDEETVESRETMIALDAPAEVTLRYDITIPYEMIVDLDLPKDGFAPNESFELSGRAYYDGAEIEVVNATVDITISGTDRRWLITTDERGHFGLEMEAPASRGDFRLVVEVRDEKMDMEGRAEETLEVDGTEEVTLNEFMFRSTIGRGITVTIIAVLLVLAYIIAAPSKISKKPPKSASDEELIEWAEEVVGES